VSVRACLKSPIVKPPVNVIAAMLKDVRKIQRVSLTVLEPVDEFVVRCDVGVVQRAMVAHELDAADGGVLACTNTSIGIIVEKG